MADTIAVMNRGQVEQLGPPTELYERPRTAFVAGFLGMSNLLPGTAAGVDDDQARRWHGGRGPPERSTAAPEARGRHPAREDPDRPRPSEYARRKRLRIRLCRRLHAIRRRYCPPGGSPSTSRTRVGHRRASARRSDHRGLRARGHIRRRPPEEERRERHADPRRAAAPCRASERHLSFPARGRVRRERERGERQAGARQDLASRTGRTTSTSTRRQGRRTLEAFTKKTGVKVDYIEDINSNSQYFGKVQGPLSRGQSINAT